jgi:hypothetical protein
LYCLGRTPCGAGEAGDLTRDVCRGREYLERSTQSSRPGRDRVDDLSGKVELYNCVGETTVRGEANTDNVGVADPLPAQ